MLQVTPKSTTNPVSGAKNKLAGDRSALALITILTLVIGLIAVSVISLQTGAIKLDAIAVIGNSLGFSSVELANPARDELILFDIRFPRLFLGLLVGSALAVSGAMLQSLFRNPLADPGLIGISAGSSLGAVVMIVLGGTWIMAPMASLGIFGLPVASFIGGLAVTALLYRIATQNGKTSVITMLLAGIAIQAFAFAFTGILIFMADDQQLRDLTFWSLGSLAGATWSKVFSIGPIIALLMFSIPFIARGLNAFALGETTAFHLGIPVQRLKSITIVTVAAMTGTSVAVSGGIGFIGIIVPHLLRLLIGPDNKYLLPASALLGGGILILADMISRTIVAPAELPIGIITALAGAPFFLWLLIKRRGIFE